MTSLLEPLPRGVAQQARAGEWFGSGARTRSYLVLFAFLIVSRAATTVYYVEDTDSLRFALSVADYDVASLRPHFPGYPVFSFLAKVLTTVLGSYAMAFSLIGAGATFAIIYYLQRVLRVGPGSPLGLLIALLVSFNPLLWLLGNRYMPDLLGAACALAALYHLLWGRREAGYLLAGLLPGIRLSYVPFLLPAVLLSLRSSPGRGIALGALGLLAWFIPLVLDTGWSELIAAAQRQTEGHFADFGGTVYTEPALMQRAVGIFRGVWAHGMGAYWPGRHPITLLVSAGAVAVLASGIRPLRRSLPPRTITLLATSWICYLIWIFFYQNVIHKSRHIAPLLPFLLLMGALGAWELAKCGRLRQVLVALFIGAYATVALVLARQHQRPTAIAQIAEELRSRRGGDLYIVSIPLANFYLSAVGVKAHFLSAEQAVGLERLPEGARVVAVGPDPGWARRPSSVRPFYHNPFVNPMWSEIVVREYAGGPE
ncbi:MAG: hypothetical protein KY464_08955 [Gemmatimonadetes bacterium]|nr:hypothetical protein [Gemmatimonadota bacterium]